MVVYIFVLVAISLVLLPFKKISLSSRLDQGLLSLIVLCYVGLTALTYNIERNVELNDQNPARNGMGWFGSNWLYVAFGLIGTIAILHIVIFVTRRRQADT